MNNQEIIMSLHKNHDDSRGFADWNYEEDKQTLSHKKHIRQLLEKRLEQKRLKEELEFFEGELDGEFDWDYFDSESK
jgi:hypothetical protein